MNIHRLLYNHHLAERNARRASTRPDGEIYFDLVGYYAKRIAAWRQAEGLSAAEWLRDEPRAVPVANR